MNIDLYAYLLLGLFFFAIWLAFFSLRKDLQRTMLWISLCGAVCGPLSEIWYFQDYWLPPTIVGQGVISPEDALFGFSVFGVAAAAYVVVLGKNRVTTSTNRPALFVLFALSFFAGFWVFTDVLAMNSIVAGCLIMALWTLGIGFVRRDLVLPSLLNGALLAIFSIVIYVALLNVATEYLQKYWLLWGTPLGLTIFGGVPITEIAWYFFLGSSTLSVSLCAEGKKIA